MCRDERTKEIIPHGISVDVLTGKLVVIMQLKKLLMA